MDKGEKPPVFTDTLNLPKGFMFVAGNEKYLHNLLKRDIIMLGNIVDERWKNWPRLFGLIMHLQRWKFLFVNVFARLAYSSGLGGDRTRTILEQHEPFKSFFKQIEKKYHIVHVFILANESGSHDFHQDVFTPGATERWVISLGCTDKTFWIMDKK